MFSNYIKVAIRNLLRYKGYSIINIVGLAIGMAAVLLIFLYVIDELSYDHFHEHAKQTYRIGQTGTIGNMDFTGSTTPAPLAGVLMEDFEEVLYSTRILEGINTVMWYKKKSFYETRYLYTDTNFFKVFSFPLIRGNPETALREPFSMVISESTSIKYFGDEDPIGKVLHEADGSDYTITGVAKDVPHNSHFHFDFLASLNTYEWTSNENWFIDSYYTYFVLQEGYPVKEFMKKLPGLSEKYFGPQLESVLGLDAEKWDKSENTFAYFIEPLTKIYLQSRAMPQIEPASDISAIYFFAIVTIFILLLAIINFSSLTTAKSATRAREMGMRKVMGSHRRQLIIQLLSESVVISFMALILALVLTELFLPTYNSIVDKSLSVKYFREWFVIPIILFVTIGIGFLAGLYSSITISSFRILPVLRGVYGRNKKKIWYRSGLVVFQFAIAVVIMISTIVVYSQLHYISKKNLGFNEKNLLVIDRAYGLEDGVDAFKDALLKHPDIEAVTLSSAVPGMEGWVGQVLRLEGTPPDELIHFTGLTGDLDFPETYQLKLVQGSYFSTKDHRKWNEVVINKSAANSLNLENPIGKFLVMPGYNKGKQQTFEIIGVVEDFHFNNLKEKIENLIIFNPGKFFTRYVTLRMNEKNMVATIKFAEDTWKQFAINQPFKYFFMEETMNTLHNQERLTAKVLTILTILALFLASLGLLGLASFSAEQRTREIGIRKAMGSTAQEISVLFLREFAKWVVAANILAWPAAYFLMQNWLNGFTYRPTFPLWTFLMAGAVSLVIAVISVVYQTISASMQNPIHSIRYE